MVEHFVKFVCKFCKVQVRGRHDHHAVLGKEHGKHCPRRKLM